MSVSLLLLLAAIHAAACVSLFVEGKAGLSLVLFGGMLVQIGLAMSARG